MVKKKEEKKIKDKNRPNIIKFNKFNFICNTFD